MTRITTHQAPVSHSTSPHTLISVYPVTVRATREPSPVYCAVWCNVIENRQYVCRVMYSQAICTALSVLCRLSRDCGRLCVT